MKPINISDKFTIYLGKYNYEYPIEDFLKYVEINHSLVSKNQNDSVSIEIKTDCFESINNYVKGHIEKISKKQFTNYAEHFWIYTQRLGYKMEWMHQHLQVHPPGRSNILTDYTFTFYLQTTTEISGDEGCIIFEDENKKRYKYLPEVGDIFIFPSDIRHTAVPTPNSKRERIVYAGSFCIDIENQKVIQKNSI